MEKKLYCTEIDCKNGHITVHQDGKFMYYKYRLDSIVFFTIKDGEYVRIDKIPISRKELYFTLKTEKLEKLPIKRVEKPKKEKFFFIDHTLFLCDDAIGLQEPKYIKQDKRIGLHTPDITSINFTLEVTWTWDGGFYTRELLWDIHDYNCIRGNAQKELENLMSIPYYFYYLSDIDKATEIIQNLKSKLQERIDWWINASIDDLVFYYNSQKKGGEKNA